MRISQRVLIGGAVAAIAIAGTGVARAAVVGTSAHTSPQFNGSVYAIAYHGDTVYVGGSFTSAVIDGRLVHRDRLAAFDTRSGDLLSWAPEANNTVRALAVSDGSVYAAGDFTEITGHHRDRLAQINGSSGAVGAFSHQVTGIPQALAVGNGKLYVGGSLSRIDSSPRTRLAAFSLGDGAIDRRWTPTADDTVHALAFAGDRVYLGGSFHRTDGARSTLRLSAVDPTTGALIPGFRPAPPAMVHSIAVDSRGVYAAMGGQGGRAAAFTTSGRTRWTRVFDGDVQGVAVLDGTAYVGGHFDHACTTARNGAQGTCSGGSQSRVKLAAVNGDGSLNSWAPQANGIVGVRTIVVDPVQHTVAVGGDFTTIGGKAQKRYAFFG
ncbi:MAG TPA: hypothetical protein VGD29_25775 [Actinoplanes sp.]